MVACYDSRHLIDFLVDLCHNHPLHKPKGMLDMYNFSGSISFHMCSLNNCGIS